MSHSIPKAREEALALIEMEFYALIEPLRRGKWVEKEAEEFLGKLEPIIFRYAPLPEHIQQALNTGDGVYRP